MAQSMSKEEFRTRWGIPRSTFVACLRSLERDMPGPYKKTTKVLTPAQVEFLEKHLC